MSPEATQASQGDCGSDECDLVSDRRSFLRDGLMAFAALTAIAGAAAPLHALAREYATGRSAAAGTVSYGIPAVDGATIDRANKLILVRYQGLVHAFSIECPHKGTVVQWQPEQSRFYCPKHKSTFKPEGSRIQGKAPRSMDRFAVRLEGGKVVVDTATLIDAKENAAGWNAASARIG